MNSVWSDTVEFEERPCLTSDISAEAAILGGGMSGILTALLLKERGIEAVVIEAQRIGSGQTKGTTAKITAQHDLIYDRLIKDMGYRHAKQYADFNLRAIDEFRRIIKDYEINCHFEEAPAYLYTEKNAGILQQECDAALSLGIDACFTTETMLPLTVSGALRFNNQAIFHPLEFLKGASRNLTVYEHTRALQVEGNRIITDRGTVLAKHIIFATHFPFINVPGYYFVKLHQGRSYVIALENAAKLDGAYLGIDDDGLSFRQFGDITLLGGGGHRTGENSIGGKYQLLRTSAQKYWPQSTEITHWSAQDCMTPDGVPYIGRYSRSRPNWYVCTGYGKWGMTSSMVAAMLISSKITGETDPSETIFSPRRQTTSPAAKAVLKNGLHAVEGLGKEIFKIPNIDVGAIPCGHGGVVEHEGTKYGVYREDSGQTFFVDIRCPHMGCMLEWNPDENSWDCPCHGSRFDYRGKLLDNPAQVDINTGK